LLSSNMNGERVPIPSIRSYYRGTHPQVNYRNKPQKQTTETNHRNKPQKQSAGNRGRALEEGKFVERRRRVKRHPTMHDYTQKNGNKNQIKLHQIKSTINQH
jgi:hypothetical protein